MADEDAKASVHDPSLWGAENAGHVRGIDLINAAHNVNVGLICVELREEALAITRRLEEARERARAAERAAIDAVDGDARALRAHPQWRPDAGGHVDAACERHAALVATLNALVGDLESLMATAGHHVHVSAADAIRQGLLYARRIQLSQPEPVTERLLPDELPRPEVPGNEALLAFMLGVTALPDRARMTTAAVTAHRGTAYEAAA
jgi:hypothetical protein